MKKIRLSPSDGKNFTPEVIKSLDELRREGGTLEFECGEYHFYKDGSLRRFFAVSNNSACDKNIVFPLIGMKNVTVDGGGSSFVFHDVTFPFAVHESENIELGNFSADTSYSPVGIFRLGRKTDEGFFLVIDEKKTPYRIEDGALVFIRESFERSGLERKFSLHGIDRRKVQYLFTGDCTDCRENLPAEHLLTDAEMTEDGLFLRYRPESPYKAAYAEGERVSTILDGDRDSDVILISESRNVKIGNVTVRRGNGMGVIAQLSESIEIDGFSTDESYHGEGSTLTADSMHFVNCRGKLDIHGCKIAYTLDDAVNIHGMYTKVAEKKDGEITARIGHAEQYYFNPYRAGDILDAVDPDTFEYTGKLLVKSATLKEGGSGIELSCESISGEVRAGELLENTMSMPDVHIHGNEFCHYPNLRVSGSGKILIENNRFAHAASALLARDLGRFWYESGRINHLVFKNNYLDDCNALAGKSFITVDVDGAPHERTPKIHGRIEISGNVFKNLRQHAIIAAGVRDLVIENNALPESTYGTIVVDGKQL